MGIDRSAVRRRSALAGLLVLVACASTDAPSPTAEHAEPTQISVPSLPPPVAGEGETDDAATILQPVQPRWAPGNDAPGVMDEWAEHPLILEPPAAVSVLGDPVEVDGVEWIQVHVLPDPLVGPRDFVAWIPEVAGGAPVLEHDDPRPCPDGTPHGLAGLTPTGRFACFADRPLRFFARSWLPGHWVSHATDPSWLGMTDGIRSVSLSSVDGEPTRRPPDPRVTWIDARVPPDLDRPPLGMVLLIEGQFGHPDAVGCRRTVVRHPGQPARGGLPDEDEAASAAWCRGQFVLTSWEIVLGPEGRPPAPGDIQLHRTAFDGPECGGVGMPMLRFRMDPAEPDPIWLEADGWDERIVPIFGRGFRAVMDPELAVIGPRGDLVARDGTALDPDAAIGPYSVCPMGEMVSITGP